MVQIISANSIGTGVRVAVANLQTAYIAAGVTVGSTDTNAIVGSSNGTSVVVQGAVVAELAAIVLGGSLTIDQTVLVGLTGTVFGGTDGIFLSGVSNEITNLGMISGGSAAIHLAVGSSFTTHVLNSGTVLGETVGIYYAGAGVAAGVQVINTGTIIGNATNFGSFFSDATLISDDVIRNRGTMIGQIDLSLGNDIYDGRGGSVDSQVFGGGDNDTFIAGLSTEDFDGGSGIDLLSFSHSAGVTASLGNTVQGTHEAAGDVYTNIENLTGSRLGVDRLYGDNGNNTLSGLGGADLLAGGLGNDVLIGGAGSDRLVGGGGNDAFQFNALTDCGDVIADYSGIVGNNDIFWISAAGFGGGLVGGNLNANQLQVGAGHVAADANVRFLYDTAGTALWFDADGNGAGKQVLVADMQASATTFVGFDIFLI